MFINKILFVAILVLLSTHALAAKVHIAVASNFTQTIKVLVQEFEKNSIHKVSLSFASSGKIYAQIKHGAPFDLFFSADTSKPSLLVADGLIVKGSRYTYALGQLVLWSNQDNERLDVEKRLKQGLFNKLAIANPRLAPYGLAAQQTLESLGLVSKQYAKRVQGENIMQTFQFISSGNAELGFVSLSQLHGQEHIKHNNFWMIPAGLYQAIKQDLVWLKRAEKNPAAAAFMNFIKKPKALNIIRKGGYQLPNVLSGNATL